VGENYHLSSFAVRYAIRQYVIGSRVGQAGPARVLASVEKTDESRPRTLPHLCVAGRAENVNKYIVLGSRRLGAYPEDTYVKVYFY
jgi:hypothetical protein